MVGWFNRLHMPIHLVIGMVVAVVVAVVAKEKFVSILPYAIVGSFLPDVDHLAFYFIYGRKSDYAKRVKGHLKKMEVIALFRFVAGNHKSLYGLYSHTWYGVLLVVLGSLMSWKYSTETGTLFLGMLFHFGFDVFEDLIFFKRINPNWKGKVLRYSFDE